MKILILGGGFAGVRAALDLEKQVSQDFEITLVSKSHNHCYIPDLYDVATARLKNPHIEGFNDLKASVDLHLEDIFKNKRVNILVDEVLSIDLKSKSVKLQNQILTYDYLVIALGSTSAYFGIPGAEQFSHPLKSAEEAIQIRNDLDNLVRKAQPTDQMVQVVITGGGFTGVELVGAMGKILGKNHKIIILEAGPNILGGMPEWAKTAAFKKLQQLGVEVRLNCRIKTVSEKVVTAADGQEVAYDYLIWTAGVAGTTLSQGITGVELGKKGQIPVSDDLSVPGFPEVFVSGDFAQIGNPEVGFVPQTAWAAIAESETVAQNVTGKIKGRPARKFIPPKAQFVVPVGELYALSSVFGLRLSGILAWILKELVALRYLISITSLNRALNVWRKEVAVDLMGH